MAYAKNTDVPVAKSKMEIEVLLGKHGATGFMSGWNQEQATIAFEMQKRRIIFRVPMPDKKARKFTHDHNGNYRSPDKIEKAWEQAQRQRWRALLLVLKAKLEAVESGITEFEEEFLAHIALPSGETTGQWMRPQIAQAYESGKMPPLLPPSGGKNG